MGVLERAIGGLRIGMTSDGPPNHIEDAVRRTSGGVYYVKGCFGSWMGLDKKRPDEAEGYSALFCILYPGRYRQLIEIRCRVTGSRSCDLLYVTMSWRRKYV